MIFFAAVFYPQHLRKASGKLKDRSAKEDWVAVRLPNIIITLAHIKGTITFIMHFIV